ncbi:tetratricopeptide repeat protein [Streptomyces sp. 16-176A]
MSARGNLGAALCRLGRLREARSVLRSVLADRERTKGPAPSPSPPPPS